MKNNIRIHPNFVLGGAVILLIISAYGFYEGLKFNDASFWSIGTLIALLSWCALTIIQMEGNAAYATGELDIILGFGWTFSYGLGIFAGMYAWKNLLGIDDNNVAWVVAFCLSGVVEIMPERLITRWMLLRNGNKLSKIHGVKPEEKKPEQPSYKPTTPVRPKTTQYRPNIPEPSYNHPQWQSTKNGKGHRPEDEDMRHYAR